MEEEVNESLQKASSVLRRNTEELARNIRCREILVKYYFF
jgi:hypothetical protein